MFRKGMAFVFACALGLAWLAPSRQASASAPPNLLPGQQIWANGVSSYLFGINETFDWATQNLETTPAAQQSLKANGFRLVRSFFSEQHNESPYPMGGTTSDALILGRFTAIENVGAQCLGVLAGSNSLAFDDHLLTLAETSKSGVDRCEMWEFHNEPAVDASYINDWNTKISYLRAHHPGDKFFGPVYSCACPQPIQNFLNAVKASGVLPDGITYHDYPCYSSTDYVASQAATCDAQITGHYAADITQIKTMVVNTLGVSLPVGITEWNVSPNFVNCVGGQVPLTVDPSYQPRFVAEMYQAMQAGGLDFATQFDAMSGAGEGTCGSLDLLKSDGSGQPWLSTYGTIVGAASAGEPLPTPIPAPASRPASAANPAKASAAASTSASASASASASSLAPNPATVPATSAGRNVAVPPADLPTVWPDPALVPLFTAVGLAGIVIAGAALIEIRRRLVLPRRRT